jgi:hypothetical protein
VGPIRYVAVQLRVSGKPQRGVFVVATSLRPARRDLVRNAQQYAALSAAALVLVGAGGWLVAGGCSGRCGCCAGQPSASPRLI